MTRICLRIAIPLLVLLRAAPTFAGRDVGRKDVMRRFKMNEYTVHRDLEAIDKGLHLSTLPNRHEALKTFQLMVRTLALGDQLLAIRRPDAYVLKGYRGDISSSLVRMKSRYALGYGYLMKNRPWALLVLSPSGVSEIEFGDTDIYDGVNPEDLLGSATDEPLETFFEEQLDFATDPHASRKSNFLDSW